MEGWGCDGHKEGIGGVDLGSWVWVEKGMDTGRNEKLKPIRYIVATASSSFVIIYSLHIPENTAL